MDDTRDGTDFTNAHNEINDYSVSERSEFSTSITPCEIELLNNDNVSSLPITLDRSKSLQSYRK